MSDTQKTSNCQNCDYIHVFDKIFPCKDCEGRLKFIAKNYQPQVAPTFPNARDCEHGRLRRKCPECHLRECEGELDRLLTAIKDDTTAEHEAFDARLSTTVNTQMLQAVNRFRARILAAGGGGTTDDIVATLAIRLLRTNVMIDQAAKLSRTHGDAQDKLTDALIDYYEAEQVAHKLATELVQAMDEEDPLGKKVSMDHNG